MNPIELPFDSSEVGNMVGSCVPLALSVYAGAIAGAIVEIIVGGRGDECLVGTTTQYFTEMWSASRG